MKIVAFTFVFAAWSFGSCAFAAETSQTISKSVSDVCKRPSEAGKYWDIKLKGDGSAKIGLLFKGFKAAGDVEFSKGEWEGVKSSVEDTADYRECVELILPVFVDKFTPAVEQATAVDRKNASRDLGGLKWVDFVSGIELVLDSCIIKADTVSCDMNATAIDQDLDIEIYGTSSVYDQNGNKMSISYARVASFNDDMASSTSELSAELVQGVKTPMTARFDNAAKDAATISKASISVGIRPDGSSDSHEYSEFDFREISLSLK